jgi:hypothetical protein
MFICGASSTAIITDFNAAEGDTKTEGCRNVLEGSVSVLDNNFNNSNITGTTTVTTTSSASGGIAEDLSATEEDASSMPGTAAEADANSSSKNPVETIDATGTAEIQKTMEVLADEESL